MFSSSREDAKKYAQSEPSFFGSLVMLVFIFVMLVLAFA